MKKLRNWSERLLREAADLAEQTVIYILRNLTRGTTLGTQVRIAGTSVERRRGLLRSEGLRPGDGLWIAPCEAIHTVGLGWPIDVAFLDGDYRIVKIVRELRPFRMAICLAAESVVELPKGVLRAEHSEIGDTLAFSPAAAT